MFVHTLLPKFKHGNRFENVKKPVILTERAVTLVYTNTWIINFKCKIPSISATKLPAQASAYVEEKGMCIQ